MLVDVLICFTSNEISHKLVLGFGNRGVCNYDTVVAIFGAIFEYDETHKIVGSLNDSKSKQP
jgi:hypothetical protein